MREIKFRAWHKRHKEMLEVAAVSFMSAVSAGFIVVRGSAATWTFDEVDLLQYMGFKDKHGTEAYDGDIYRNLDSGLIGKFTILDGVGGYYVNCTEYKDGHMYNNHPFALHDTTNFEIIGTIHETPDLVESH